jgi:hypothetical protein
MAKRASKQDVAKAKAAKQKKIAIGGAVVLVALLAFEVPKTMKMLHQNAAPPVVQTTATTPTVTPADPNSLAAPTLGGTPAVAPATTPTDTTSDLVAAVPVTVDPGQIETFQKFASKDPFAVQVTEGGSSGLSGSSAGRSSKSSGGSSTPTTNTPTTLAPAPSSPSVPSSPGSAAAPTSAIISLNGELQTVAVKGDFPTTGATFTRVGTIFHLVSLTAKTAKIAIVGGSYADGAPAITLKIGTPLTLQNTADGTKYTLILEPPTTQIPSAAAVTTSPAATVSAVPSGSGG